MSACGRNHIQSPPLVFLDQSILPKLPMFAVQDKTIQVTYLQSSSF